MRMEYVIYGSDVDVVSRMMYQIYLGLYLHNRAHNTLHARNTIHLDGMQY